MEPETSSSSVGEVEAPLWPMELANLIDESIRKCFLASKNRARIVPLSDLPGVSPGSLGDDGYVGFFVPVEHLHELLEFCSLELGLSFECPDGLVDEESAVGSGESWSSSEKYRDCTRLCDACCMSDDGNLQGGEELANDERSGVVSASRGYCKIKRFRAMFRNLLDDKVSEATGVVLARMGTEVDAQGRIVFRQNTHDSD